jgi:hypothetical protein
LIRRRHACAYLSFFRDKSPITKLRAAIRKYLRRAIVIARNRDA